MKNRELFVLDPVENKLLNNGVAEIGTDKFDFNGQKIIKYELKTFVCEGEYERGLSRILDTYIKNINDPMQPAVWVSGFFGSGKSHLVKMLGYLWEDFEFPSSDTARKIKKLPVSVSDKLFELSKYQKKLGKLSISGTLKDFPSDDIRYSFLQFFLKGLGLPTQFHQFKFINWLKQEEIYDDLENYIVSEGKNFKKEYQNFIISPFISKGILKLKPKFAENEAKVREYLKANFERVNKISREDMLSTIKDEVLPLFYEKTPCILVVLDEVQQFISSDGNKTIEVQNLAQDLSNGFDGKLLFVATGQNALIETPFLQPLNDRFKVKVFLSDQDVETVTRKTVLEKKPIVQKSIKSLMDKSSGEVARNMQNTAFAYQSKDETNLVADYPILPSTRKFWKKVLDVIDTAGTQGQLRSQLRIVDESVKKVAILNLGAIIPGDFIYEQKEQQLLQNARLLNDTYNLIVEKKAGNADEQLQGRILSIAFLLDQIPSGLPGGTPKSNKDTIADLLISDLSQSTDAFRLAVNKSIDALVEQKLLMPIGNEVRLQTKAGQEWEKEYTAQVQKLIAQGDDKIQVERINRVSNFFESMVRGIRLVHGDAKVSREINVHAGSQKPSTENKVNIWLRDGWMENEKLVLEEIRREGTDVPLSYAFIKKMRDADLKNEITKYLAAKESLELKGIPSDPEGQQARRSMETRAEKANEAIVDLINRIAEDADIYLAGGTKIQEDSPKKTIEKTLKQMLDRQFYEFGKADLSNWPTALRSALNKNPNPLERIGHKNDVNSHPVAVAILRFMAKGSYLGRDIRNNFSKSPFGWPQDAIDTLLIALVNAEYISSSENPLPQGKIGVSSFKKETHTLTASDKIKLRKMYTYCDIKCAPGDEFKSSGILLQELMRLAQLISGDAPLPEPINTASFKQIEFQDGNERLQLMVSGIQEMKDKYASWKNKAELVDKRLPGWELLEHLLDFGSGDEIANIITQANAIEQDRLLLANPDPIGPLLQKTTDILKSDLNGAITDHNIIYDNRLAELHANEYFVKLPPEDKQKILLNNQILKKPEFKDHDADSLKNSLSKTSLDAWQTKIFALNSQFDNAIAEAVKLLEPKAESFNLPRKTLTSSADITTYIKALQQELEEILKSAKSIILK
jgi:hypothetical protein